jgi:hypothetical protein
VSNLRLVALATAAALAYMFALSRWKPPQPQR